MRKLFMIVAAGIFVSFAASGPSAALPRADIGPAPRLKATGEKLKLTDEKLTAFIDAANQVQRVRREWTAKIERAKSERETLNIRAAAGEAMMQAVRSAPGITVDEYVAVVRAAQTNRDLWEEIRRRLSRQPPQ